MTQSNAFIYIDCMHVINAQHTAVKRASCHFKHKKPRHEDSSLNSNNSWPFRFIWKTVLSSLLPASNLPPTKTHRQRCVRACRQRAIRLHKVSRILKGDEGRKKKKKEKEKEAPPMGDFGRDDRREREGERSRRQMVALNSVLPKTTHKDLRVMD